MGVQEMNLKVTPITLSIHRDGDNPLFGDSAIHISCMDEGGGLFFKLEQVNPEASEPNCYEYEELIKITEVAKELESTYRNK